MSSTQKLAAIAKIRRQLAELCPRSITRIYRPTAQEFLQNYYSTNTPVIIDGAIDDWACWTPEYFKANYGNTPIEIQSERDANPNYEIDKQRHIRTINFGDYIDRIIINGRSNDDYIVASNEILRRGNLSSLLDRLSLPDFISTTTPDNSFLWIGGAGTITPPHHDLLNIVMAQIYGRKRWWLADPRYADRVYNHIGVFSQVDLSNPDFDRFPLLREVPIIDVVVEPGQMIFVPIGWWHQVESLDTSISMSMTGFAFPNNFDWH